MNLKQRIKKQNLYREFLKIINGVQELPQREIDILSLLMKIDEEWHPRSNRDVKNVTSTDNRRYVMAETRILKPNFTKYLNTLRKRGLLVKNEHGGDEVLRDLFPKVENGKVSITFILELGENV
jgi:hypothetical protein